MPIISQFVYKINPTIGVHYCIGRCIISRRTQPIHLGHKASSVGLSRFGAQFSPLQVCSPSHSSSALHLSTHAADQRFKQVSAVEQAVVNSRTSLCSPKH